MPEQDMTSATLLDMTRQLTLELHPYKASSPAITLDSSLERDLALDSLGRVELLRRLEQAFQVRLPESLLAAAETPRDILRALQSLPAPSLTSRPRPERPPTLPQADALPLQARTLIEALDWHVHAHPQRPHVYLCQDADAPAADHSLTYEALAANARALAAGLLTRGCAPGQTVAIMLPTGRHFLESFLGVLLIGGIPVPIYPPARRSQLEEHMRRQAAILANARAVMLITVPEAQSLARLLRLQVAMLAQVVTPQELLQCTDTPSFPVLREHDIAFIQYTSGSTGTPKGVVLTHANLLANIRAMQAAVQATPDDVFVSWLPLYHDMGLIGAWLGSLYCAYPLVLMSPLTFLAHPLRWLQAIHHYRGSISGAPNFAYELCAQKLTEDDLAGLDLSTWRLAFNGAEPVSPETMERFCARFARYGFRPEAMTPVYGLAENSLGLAFPPLNRGPRTDRIARERFIRSRQAVPAGPAEVQPVCFVSCGQPLPGYQIRVVDALGYEVAERQQGSLEFRGPSATSGYWHNPAATQQLFHGEWLVSGDLAYIAAGEVYLTGRAKDVIIRAGRNLYPHELEDAIGQMPGMRRGCVAVFGSRDPVTQTERLIVLAETRQTSPQELALLRHQIDTLAVDILGTPPDDVVLAPPYTVLKTSSGKVRRGDCRELYERGKLAPRSRALWWQIVRLAVAGVVPQGRRLWHSTAEIGYTGYAWLVFALCGALAFGTTVALPTRRWRQVAVRFLARLGLRLAGIPLVVEGLEHLPRHQPYVVVANHASYLDAFVLQAALPGDIAYVAKQELAKRFLTRFPLQRLGVEFVERFDAQRGIEDTAKVVQVVQQGGAVVFFPEGTFGREPGLHSFRMGAFIVATQTGVPLLPLVIRGTRSVLRADQWLLRRAPVRVMVSAPLAPSGTSWSAAILLRDAARAQMLRECGEPDLLHEVPALFLRQT